MPTKHVDALVLFAADPVATAEFYRAIGIALVEERHDDGPIHYACELGPVHLAIYAATGAAGTAGERRAPGSSLIGFQVGSLDDALAAAAAAGAPVIQPRQTVPWGARAIVRDPDGREVELNQAADREGE